MKKIKEKINKLLRLALSDNPNEANLASQKVIELMEKHSITDKDLTDTSIIIKEIEVEYARVPKWYRNLYRDIAKINGCYMVWRNGSKANDKKAKIIITGLEKDVENIEYYIEVIKIEISNKVNKFKKTISSEREIVKSYRMGLVGGLYNTLYKASQTFNEKIKDKSIVPVDKRSEISKEYYLNKFSVRIVSSINTYNNRYYNMGFEDANSISVNRPIKEDKEIKLLDK